MRTYLFSRIHRGNWILAYVLSWFGEVRAQKVDLPSWLNSEFGTLEFEDVDSWDTILNESYNRLKNRIAHFQALATLSVNSRGRQCDLSAILLQTLIHEANEATQFILLAEKVANSEGARVVESDSEHFFRKHCLVQHPLKVSWFSFANRVSERIWRWISLDLKLLLATIRGAFFLPRIQASRAQVVIRGIAPLEYATSDHQLDFAWWIKQGYLSSKDVLFVLPVAPGERVAMRLGELGVRWILNRDVVSLLPRSRAWLLVLETLRTALGRSLSWSCIGSYRMHIQTAARVWVNVFEKVEANTFITSLSEAWPEGAEVQVAKFSGIKTINWSYAGSSFYFAKSIRDFRDQTLWRSVSVAHESWGWSDEICRLMRARQLLPEQLSSEFVAVGPLMCGDPSCLELDPASVREKYGMRRDPDRFYLSVFDIPLYRAKERLRIGYPPYTTFESQNGFFRACMRALESYPELVLILKTKRVRSPQFETFPAYEELVSQEKGWVELGRVVSMDAQVDPYFSIAASDACLGVPLTSPVMLGRQLKKPSWYYDCTGAARVTFDHVFDSMIIHEEKALIEAIGAAIQKWKQTPDLGQLYASEGKVIRTRMRTQILTHLKVAK